MHFTNILERKLIFFHLNHIHWKNLHQRNQMISFHILVDHFQRLRGLYHSFKKFFLDISKFFFCKFFYQEINHTCAFVHLFKKTINFIYHGLSWKYFFKNFSNPNFLILLRSIKFHFSNFYLENNLRFFKNY